MAGDGLRRGGFLGDGDGCRYRESVLLWEYEKEGKGVERLGDVCVVGEYGLRD